MFERSRPQASDADSAHLLSPEDVRRRLEGRVETVETARARYQALNNLLEDRRWKRRLGKDLGPLDEVARQEPDFEEALSAIQHRAQKEDWPREHPVLDTVREVLRRRDRLDALLDKQLGSRPSPEPPAPSRLERLTRLRALCVRAPVPSLVPGEILLAEGHSHPSALPFSAHVVGLFLLVLVSSTLFLGLCVGLAVGVGAGMIPLLLRAWRRSARYWLTPERLVWEAFPGELTQLLLRDIPPNGVSVPFTNGIHVAGPHETLTLGMGRDEQQRMLATLELYRRAPLLGHAASRPLPDVVCFPATLQPGAVREGCAILRPGYLAFLPEDRLADVFQAVTGEPWTHLPLELRHVLETLRHLPSGAEFDASIERAVAQAEGVLWSPKACVRYDAQQPVWKQLHFKSIEAPARALSGAVERREGDTAERILSAWPRR
ncbi:MAG: hypothetical protein ABW123_24460 [Cystobacter sp.]